MLKTAALGVFQRGLRVESRAFPQVVTGAVRQYSSTQETELKAKLRELIPERVAELKQFKAENGEKSLGDVTVNMALGGMRGIKGLFWETSLLDSHEGIRYRGHTLVETEEKLPKSAGGSEPQPEGLLWLLLTGQMPTESQAASVTADLMRRTSLPDTVSELLDRCPKTLHPMSQLVLGLTALQEHSKFARGYREGATRAQYWDLAYEDALDVIAKVPLVAARIYRNIYHDGSLTQPDLSVDYSHNLSTLLGFGDNTKFTELLRLYLVLHADHEGGNVSAHTTHLVGSALSDPYLSLAAGMAGLAGPLHGLANQEVLNWILEMNRTLGTDCPSEAQIEKYCWDTLNSGRVVPGYGHAVLRRTDPRYASQREFALKHLPDDPLFKTVSNMFNVVPRVLTKHGKTKNPWPNVDAHSGVLLRYYGLVEQDFYTVLFGVSRAFGVLSQLVWDRAYSLPIERPKSLTLAALRQAVASKK